MIIKNNIAHAFNRAAQSYNENCNVQRLIGKKLLQHLVPFLKNPTNIADYGCGTGKITEEVIKQFQAQQIYAIDFAANLLAQAKARLSYQAITFIEDNFEKFHAPIKFDLIFANMSLHWSQSLADIIHLAIQQLSLGGYLAFSIPLKNTFLELPKENYNLFYSPEEIMQFCHAANKRTLTYYQEKITTFYPSWISALKALKSVGANYITKEKKIKSLQGKNFFANRMRGLAQMYPQAQLTYQIGYFIVKKT